jgi:hypothetical protein
MPSPSVNKLATHEEIRNTCFSVVRDLKNQWLPPPVLLVIFSFVSFVIIEGKPFIDIKKILTQQ